ncbi:MAG: DUF4013 domain-containing protein [Syntrophomonadaceae bacterium]|jgi:hypothetical protein
MHYKELLAFPFKDPEWVKKIILGCFISIVPVLNILAIGYFTECIRIGIRGEKRLPDWEDMGDLAKKGVTALVIIMAYMLIPFIILLLPGPGVFLLVLLFVLAGVMLPMALANYIVNMNIASAFNFQQIFYQIGRVTNDYLVAYLVLVLVYTLCGLIFFGAPLAAFLGSLLIFYSGVVYFTLVGLLYHIAVYG